MVVNLTHKDVEWLSAQHPGLQIKKSEKILEGDIYINRSYNAISLSGVFSIRIELFTMENSSLPKVFIVSDHLSDISKKLGKKEIDLHVNYDQSLCMVIAEKEKECFREDFTLPEFFENCIEPYFYWIMYYEKYGYKPWGEYAHGELAFFEMYADGDITYEKLVRKFDLFQLHHYLQVDIDQECLCGNPLPMKLCHPNLSRGLNRMQTERKLRELHQKQQFINKPTISSLAYYTISQ
jgi:hypothetical protein